MTDEELNELERLCEGTIGVTCSEETFKVFSRLYAAVPRLIAALRESRAEIGRLKRAVEDLDDANEARKALADKGSTVPYEEFRKELGL